MSDLVPASELGIRIQPPGIEVSAIAPRDFSSLTTGIKAAVSDLPPQSLTKEDALFYQAEHELFAQMQQRIEAAGNNTEVTLITAQDFHHHFPTEQDKKKALHGLAKGLVEWDTGNYPLKYLSDIADKAANDEITARTQSITIKSTRPDPIPENPKRQRADIWAMPARGNNKIEVTFTRPGQLTKDDVPIIKAYRQ